jgi:glyoxylase-like metal-dependent hydrolase (beta-lactamase superfamily II)
VEIVPGLHLIAGLSQVYVYEESGRLTLIDTGLFNGTQGVLDAIASIGRKPEDLAQIVVTHSHADHTGSLAALVERTDARVLVHALDADVVRGLEPEPPPVFVSDEERAIFERVTPLVPPAPPCRVDRELQDGDEIDLAGGARVIHAPGHTAGSVAVYVASRRILFSGDSVERDLENNVIVGVFNTDPSQARASARMLAQLDVEVACFGHGRPLDKEVSLHLRRFADSLAT